MGIFRQLGIKRGLAEFLTFIAVYNDADDMKRVVDTRVGNRREVEVATPYVGVVHLIQPLPDLRDAKDVAGRQLEHRAKFLGRKDSIVPEADLPSAILRPCVDVECDDELMCLLLVR